MKPLVYCSGTYIRFDLEHRPFVMTSFEKILSVGAERERSQWYLKEFLMRDKSKKEGGTKEVGHIKSHFLDSGAFTIWTRAAKYAEDNKCGRWDYYDSDEFYNYMDAYAAFVKKYRAGIDLFANLDAIGNPELTWRNQKYLEEKHGLTPVPVVHWEEEVPGTKNQSFRWLRHYIKEGYDLIGLGGMVGSLSQSDCRNWLEDCFSIVCDTPDRLPKVKLHGFGVTSVELMTRFPFYSVDSTTWLQVGSYGNILVPRKVKGAFYYLEDPFIVGVSVGELAKLGNNHYLKMSKPARRVVDEWLDLVGIPLGTYDKNGAMLTPGVMTEHTHRRAVNLHFFERLCQALPEYPWPFHGHRTIKGFDLRRKQ